MFKVNFVLIIISLFCFVAAGARASEINGGTIGTVTSSVSNVDNSLTFSPNSGAVIGSINVGNTNTWSAKQVFNGTVGIGTSVTSSSVLTVSGLITGSNADFVCMGTGGAFFIQASACTISKRELKKNITNITGIGAIDDIKQLNPVRFKFKPTKPVNPDPNSHNYQYGFIADEVASVDHNLAIYENDMVTPKSYRQEAIIALLVKAVQYQQDELDIISEGRDGYRCYGIFWCKDK